MGRFNGFWKATVLRISEARDLGEFDRFSFYDHLKIYTAAPPDMLRVDEKNLREHNILNCVGIVITTNHKSAGIYLPADDRRHFVAWSELSKEDFDADYWDEIWSWYDDGGYGHVAAYLAGIDLSQFNVKAPPPKTAAFYAIVDAGRAPEDAEFADAIDALSKDGQRPKAVTLEDIRMATTDAGFGEWLIDRKNRTRIPHRMEANDYVPVRNDARGDGRWRVDGKRETIYALKTLTLREQQLAAKERMERDEC
jgi:hypothetical protein